MKQFKTNKFTNFLLALIISGLLKYSEKLSGNDFTILTLLFYSLLRISDIEYHLKGDKDERDDE